MIVKSLVLLYRLDSAASPNNRRGRAGLIMIMRLERAVAATAVARTAGTGITIEFSTLGTASYSQMTARTVRVSGTEPFQSAAMQRYQEYRKDLKKHRRAKHAKQRNKNSMQNLTQVSEATASGTAKIRQ
eukprot:6179307-Pleurochrysis_carterae.AAC.1